MTDRRAATDSSSNNFSLRSRVVYRTKSDMLKPTASPGIARSFRHTIASIRFRPSYFWAPAGATDAQLLKSYSDGRKRIEAIVCRKLLAMPGEAVGLSMSDFVR